MTDPHRHLAEDDLVELALGTRQADETTIAAHLAACSSCRAAYDEISRALEALLPASPAVEPAAGFEGRVLAAVAAQEAPVRNRVRRGHLLVAAAAVAGLAVGGVIGAAARGPDRSPAGTGDGTGDGTALVTAGGDTVGTVLTGSYAGHDVLVVQVEDGPPGKHYTCRLRLGNGEVRAAGDWVLPASGDAVWVTPAPEGTTRVELVTDAGALWSSARLTG